VGAYPTIGGLSKAVFEKAFRRSPVAIAINIVGVDGGSSVQDRQTETGIGGMRLRDQAGEGRWSSEISRKIISNIVVADMNPLNL